MSSSGFPRAGFFIRLAAIVYDLLVVAAVLMFAAAMALAFSVALATLGWWPLAEGMDHSERIDHWLFQVYLVVVLVGFYGLFWSRGGQTLGMKAWRLRVQNTNNQAISFRQAIIRFFTALGGLGNIWVVFNRDKLALQDLAAKCEVVRLTPEANQFKNWRQPAQEAKPSQ
ncbi:RDD family protein [Aliidiomarina quisquiliarum]|uniref:RDD family protein n=1 Tax=Aliidiomarina quisquiliarum TaxID=2938947 RepID=UPI00208FDD13|nr:RDD family protein [Aliidiomarina quisquiliarum]MCO4321887.1 RDD family protein [Aliidiomarina quisquiliarum]